MLALVKVPALGEGGKTTHCVTLGTPSTVRVVLLANVTLEAVKVNTPVAEGRAAELGAGAGAGPKVASRFLALPVVQKGQHVSLLLGSYTKNGSLGYIKARKRDARFADRSVVAKSKSKERVSFCYCCSITQPHLLQMCY